MSFTLIAVAVLTVLAFLRFKEIQRNTTRFINKRPTLFFILIGIIIVLGMLIIALGGVPLG